MSAIPSSWHRSDACRQRFRSQRKRPSGDIAADADRAGGRGGGQRVAEEALTNVHKHAPRAAVTIALRCTGDRCELDVRDTGGEAGELAGTGGGYGLTGMRERAELIGGSLSAGPDGQGFRVLLQMPG